MTRRLDEKAVLRYNGEAIKACGRKTWLLSKKEEG